MPQDPTVIRVDDLIRREASTAGVPPELALAVAEQESRLNPTAVNPTPVAGGQHAVGTFQLLPSTAADLGVDPTNPVQNIQGGVRYLRQLMDRHNGDLNKVLAEYGGVQTNTTYVPEVLGRMSKFRGASGPTSPPAASPRSGAPPAPPQAWGPWLWDTATDLGIGVLKGAGQTATNLGELVHQIPGVTPAVDALYGQPGLSHRAFAAAHQDLAPTSTAQTVGKMGEQVGELIVPSRAVAAASARAARLFGGRVLPTAAKMTVEAAGEAGMAAAQGGDMTTGASFGAAVPLVGAVTRGT